MNSKDTRAALLVAKRADGGALTGDMTETPQRNLNSIGLYSKAAELARGLQQPTGTTQQYMAHLAKQGVKPAEFENAGVPNSPKISRENLASHFESAVPNIGVTKLLNNPPMSPLSEDEKDRLAYLNGRDVLGENHPEGPLDEEEQWERDSLFETNENPTDLLRPDKTRYHDYKSEIGGDNYREHLLTLPAKSERIFGTYGDKDYMSSHWDQPNVLAHVRMQDAQRSEDGKKTIHVDEIQSDWAQDGRKNGFRTPDYEKNINKLEMRKDIASARHIEIAQRLFDEGLSFDQIMAHPEHEYALKNYEYSSDELEKATEKRPVSEGPYVKNTSHWVDLALKHVLHEASKGDYDKVQFATGQENADRYGLEKKYASIHYDPVENKLHTIDRNNNHEVYRAKPSELPEYLGDNLSEKLLATDPGPSNDVGHNESIFHELHGDDLVTGGEGMKSFYDKILPKAAMKLIQQHDPEIKPEKIKGSDGTERFGFSFTPRAKRSIMKGQSAFARGGKVEPTDAQKSAGNYKKKHINFQGLPISIENEKGSIRSGQDEKGNKWSVKMPTDYGYVKRTEGADGDHVDVYVGPDETSSNVFVIDQKDHRTGKFDEHKVMLGFDSLRSAIQSYTNGFSDGKAHLRLGNVARLSVKEFKQWLSHHDTKKPIRNQSAIDRALSVAKSAQGAKNGI